MSIPQTDYTLSNPRTTRRKPILCVDFDGVVHSYITPWTEAHIIPDPPVDGAFDALKAYGVMFDVQIYSARSQYLGGIAAMVRWFIAWRWPIREGKTQAVKGHGHMVEDVPVLQGLSFPTSKPKAFLTLDDRCVCFTGIFPTASELMQFKTWQQRSK